MAIANYKYQPTKDYNNCRSDALPGCVLNGANLPSSVTDIITIPSADTLDTDPHVICGVYNSSPDTDVVLCVKLCDQPNDEWIIYTISPGQTSYLWRFCWIKESASSQFAANTTYYLYA